MGVSRKVKGCFKEVSMCVSRMFQGSRVYQESFKGVSVEFSVGVRGI